MLNPALARMPCEAQAYRVHRWARASRCYGVNLSARPRHWQAVYCILPDMTAITVLIACRNGEETLEETLTGIASQVLDQSWEVVLADNGSTDRSVAVFERFAERHPSLSMRVVDASEQPGKSYALNIGVAAAAGRAIILNDADDVMAPHYLATLGGALENEDLVGGGNEFTRLNPEWIFEVWPIREVRERRPTAFPPHLPFTGGNSMGFTRELFEAIGGFDAAYDVQEDLDFCFRAQLAGYKLKFLPEATMHYRRRTDPAAIRRQFYSYARFEVKLAREYAGGGCQRLGAGDVSCGAGSA
jgi:GT2 family glycosyltransferase